MDPSPDDLPWHRNPLFWSFTDQTLLGHVATVVVGIGVFCANYALWSQWIVGDLSVVVASGSDASSARLVGLRIATIVSYVWFSIAFMIGKGGPLRNYWLYPLVSLLTGMYLLPLALFGRVPSDPLGTGAVTFLDVEFVFAVVGVFVPGFGVGLVFGFGFLGVVTYVLDREDEWAAKHLPPEYRRFERAASRETTEEQ
jgi:hypothetical protein